MATAEIYDLLIIVDATASMGSYLDSLNQSLPQIISISSLTGCFSRIGLLAYRDYGDDNLLEWSNWHSLETKGTTKQSDLVALSRSLQPTGGDDYPEATKTALAKAYQEMRKEATTLILLYTDAPPHTKATHKGYGFYPKEKSALSVPTAYGGYGPFFADWVTGCKKLRNGEKPAQVFCVLSSMMKHHASYYNYLCALTNGACIFMDKQDPQSISQVTVDALLAFMGAEKAGASQVDNLPGSLTRYIKGDGILSLKSEDDTAAETFISVPHGSPLVEKKAGKNITEISLSTEVLRKYLPKKRTPVTDFSKRYASDDAYKRFAVDQLRKIIEDNVMAVSLNPVFGSLWRTVCNDRNNEARDELVQAFGNKVNMIDNAESKANMKNWLEESYDYSAEVLSMIQNVPEAERFPCVCLDPTLAFERPENGTGDNDDDEENRPITAFTRDELLEIGRSCSYKILRRLGRVLTRLTYIETADDIPAHLAAVGHDEVPKIPVALAKQEFESKFWRILLHLVVPGTLLSSRAAALVAALSLRMGVKPLEMSAEKEMLRWRNKWNDLEVPETWSVGCLGLLQDADKLYRQKFSNRPAINDEVVKTLLSNTDRKLFETLVSYKMLEMNLDTTLIAKVGWTPKKTKMAIGPIVTCLSCKLPRSVTVMGDQGRCGLCHYENDLSPAERRAYLEHGVNKTDGEKAKATWVECYVPACRVQYVIYHPKNLNVRPKCHYCRSQKSLPPEKRSPTPAPCVECTQCSNRFLWPKAYRSSTFVAEEFVCHACTSGKKTIVDIETSARKLSQENGRDWLLKNEDNKITSPFNNRSLYHTISVAGIDGFASKVSVLPVLNTAHLSLILFHRGKEIKNSIDVVHQLNSWVTNRRTESGTCSLCFENFKKSDLHPACGRSGCHQTICNGCLANWYGINGPGRVINTAALHCAFCRRKPAARTLAKYGMGIHAVPGLERAVRSTGRWIYAWCKECGHAREYMERVCAAGAAPAVLQAWECEECAGKNRKGPWLGRYRACPKCGTMTEKMGGCSHISCSVAGCEAHWCWDCGKEFDRLVIYRHMAMDHDTYYREEEEEEEDDGYV